MDLSKVFFIVFFLIIISTFSFSQDVELTGEEKCTGKLILKSKNFKKYPYYNYNEFVFNYFNTNYPNSSRFIDTSFTSLRPIRNIFYLPFKAYFNDKIKNRNFNIILNFKERKIKVDLKKVDYLYVYPETIIADSLGYNYEGEFVEDSIISIFQIKNMIIQFDTSKFEIPGEIFKNIINPNISNNFLSLKPIRCFYSESNNHIYIYIYGIKSNNDFEDLDQINKVVTYLAKIIIDPVMKENPEILILPGIYIKSYGWDRCEDYNGF